jgi:tRNA pseudouridine55 synthase
LARDIGKALGSGAHLTALCRTRVGEVKIADCYEIDDLVQYIETEINNNK